MEMRFLMFEKLNITVGDFGPVELECLLTSLLFFTGTYFGSDCLSNTIGNTFSLEKDQLLAEIEWKLVWGSDEVARQLQVSGTHPYIPLQRNMYGHPDIIFGTSETNIQGNMVTSGTIIVSDVKRGFDFVFRKSAVIMVPLVFIISLCSILTFRDLLFRRKIISIRN